MGRVLFKPLKTNLPRAYLVCNLIWGLAFSVPVCGQPRPFAKPAADPQEQRLQLPSFAIFGLPGESAGVEKPVTAKELEKFVAGVEKNRARKGVIREPNYYALIPIIFYRARNLFAKEPWTKEEIKQGQAISAFFARIFAKPELKIEKADPESFRNGLKTLSNWFVSLCQDNRTLGLMIYTEDRGPFFGEDVDAGRMSELRLLGAIEIPDQEASFVVMKDQGQPEPIIIGVVNADTSVRWLKRFSGLPTGRVTSATLVQRTIFQLQGHGYVCRLMADWSYGFDPSVIYLDDALNLVLAANDRDMAAARAAKLSGALLDRLALDDPFQAPAGYPVKADTNTGLYWIPGSGDYDAARAEIWFASEEFALTNGFVKG